MRKRYLLQCLAPVLAMAMLGAACGDDDDTGGATSEPQRIVSLSPTATEMLFAIDAGDLVVAVDDQSDFPEDIPDTKLSAYPPNVEAVAGYEPDLVVVPDDTAVAELEALGIEALVLPAAITVADTYGQITQLGALTGNADEAADLVTDMQAEFAEILASVPAGAAPLTYYHELDDTYYSITSATFIGELYSLAGLTSIADAVSTADDFGYPQLSGEYILSADPDLIFLADTECCQQSAASVAERPGWDVLGAIQEGRVVELSDDVASRWGPRVVELLQAIVDAAQAARGG